MIVFWNTIVEEIYALLVSIDINHQIVDIDAKQKENK
jgi:hypothetical protein